MVEDTSDLRHLKVIKDCIKNNSINIHENDDELFRLCAKFGHFEVLKFLAEQRRVLVPLPCGS